MCFKAVVTFTILLVISSRAEVTCSALELISTLSSDDLVIPAIILPFDVCTSTLTYLIQDGTTTEYATSVLYHCEGGVPYVASYTAAGCEGTAAYDMAIATLYSTDLYTVNTYCDLPACDVVNVNMHTATNLDCDDPLSTSYSSAIQTAYIGNFCNVLSSAMSAKWSCNGTDATYVAYMNTDCSGDAWNTVLYDMSAGLGCGDTDSGVSASYSFDFECGEASVIYDSSTGTNTGGSNTGDDDDDDDDDDDLFYGNNATKCLCNIYVVVCALLFCMYVW